MTNLTQDESTGENTAHITVVIVNWNTSELLRECLESLFSLSPGITLDVRVVDNGSTDGSSEMVADGFPQVRLTCNLHNRGFAAANNQAMARPLAPYVLLLNSDTVIINGAIGKLHNFIQANSRCAVVAPKLVHPEGRYNVLACGYQPTLRTLLNHYSLLSRVFKKSRFFRGVNLWAGVHDDQPREIEWVSGACMMVRTSAIEQVGLLDDSWFMYAEDMEWCDRLRSTGSTIVHLPDAQVLHYGGASSEGDPTIAGMYVANLRRYYVMREEPSAGRLLAFDLVVGGGVAMRAIAYMLWNLLDRRRQRLWSVEARKFRAFAKVLWYQRANQSAVHRPTGLDVE